MNPIITVIVPVYNIEKYLDRCVSSILNQTLKNLEVILVDDGSIDASPSLCDEYKKLDNRIKVIHQQNLGVSAARNAGLKVARGKYVTFIDGDDWIENDTYDSAISAAELQCADIVQWNFIFSDGKNKNLKNRQIKKDGILAITKKTILNPNSNSVWNKIFLKELIDENKMSFPIGITVGEDRYFSYCCMACAKKIYQLSACFYYYFINPSSVMRSNYTMKKINDDIKSIVLTENFLKERNICNFDSSMQMTKIRVKNYCYGALASPDFNIWRNTFKELNLKSALVKDKTAIINWLLLLHLDFLAMPLVKLGRKIYRFE